MKKISGQITGLLSPFLATIRMKKIARIVKGGEILDFGCGNGKLSEILTFTTYNGVDINTEVIENAKIKNMGVNNVNFFSINEFDSLQKKYDYIILSAVLEHFQDPISQLGKLIKMLNFQGKLIITTPTRIGNEFLRFGSIFGFFSRSAFEEHNQIFSKNDFVKIAQILDLNIDHYSAFECGLNQLVVFTYDE
jgi:2-polyprenyl-3-methyl-5-hydroxy-6-metoxy-1,4-benzoquinol methylase